MNALATGTQVGIEIDGGAISDAMAAILDEVRVQQRLSQPSVCELRFVAGRDAVRALENLRVGSGIEVKLPEANDSLFKGEITAVEYSYGPSSARTIRVRCYDRLHRLRKRRPVQTHVQITPAELARELTADLGLSVEAEEDGPLSQYIIQYRQSDLELLVGLCRRCGLYLALDGDVLHLITLAGVGGKIDLELGKNLHEARLELNAEVACRSIVARGWDASRVEAHESRAESTRLGRSVSAEAPPDRFGGSGEGTMTGQAFPDDHHANAIAQAELDERVAREVTFWGVVEGNADLRPGSRVEVSGVADDFAGTYVLGSVDHTVSRRSGFVSEVSTLLPKLDSKDQAAQVMWGTVTSVDDPDKLGRVRATLPALGKVETDWMGVMSAGAGGSKGFVILPDVDDQVLVLFIGGDPSQAVVLGGLYGANGPGDYGVDGSSVRRYSIGTAGGQKIKLDDTGKCIRLENKGGSYIDMSPEKVIVFSATRFEIQAPGAEIVISGKSIDFRKL